MIKHHPDFQLAKSALIISTEFPFFGASPEGLVYVFVEKIVRKLFSKEKHIQIPDNAISEKVCYCGGKGSGELFPCFNKQCKYGTFQTQEKVVMSRCRQQQLLSSEGFC